jgi:RecG-like helicase
VQAVASSRELVRPGEKFELTDDQRAAVDLLISGLEQGRYEFLLRAPTGSGKTEVFMRVAVDAVLRSGGYACIVAPTRDLVRQHVTYFTERLAGTGLSVGQLHSGASPAERKAVIAGVESGSIRFVIGSAMMLSNRPLWELVDRSALFIVDDVNAFDEREHLRLIEDLDCPLIFASATPDELRSFLRRVGAFANEVKMSAKPFDVLPTAVRKVEGVWGEPPAEQITRADALVREHLERKSRIFVIGRTRGDVPRLAERLEATYGVPVQQLRGDMVDSNEQRRRARRRGIRVHGAKTRVEMMAAFTTQSPSILAATNLVGSGLDIPAADLIVITDADAFGESEVEQLIGRVGRRERPSDAILITGTTFERNPSRAIGTGRVRHFGGRSRFKTRR